MRVVRVLVVVVVLNELRVINLVQREGEVVSEMDHGARSELRFVLCVIYILLRDTKTARVMKLLLAATILLYILVRLIAYVIAEYLLLPAKALLVNSHSLTIHTSFLSISFSPPLFHPLSSNTW